MPDGHQPGEPTELIYLPRPSWAPAFLAFGGILLINGIYGEGFLVRGWVYMFAGVVVVLVALRSMVAGAVRDFFERPRRQVERAAVLPAATIRPPPKQR
jgi:hypothetical protein